MANNILFDLIMDKDFKNGLIDRFMECDNIKENYDIVINLNTGLGFVHKKAPLVISFFFPSNNYFYYIARVAKDIGNTHQSECIYLHTTYLSESLHPRHSNFYIDDDIIDIIIETINKIHISCESCLTTDGLYPYHKKEHKADYILTYDNNTATKFVSKIPPEECYIFKDLLIKKNRPKEFKINYDAEFNLIDFINKTNTEDQKWTMCFERLPGAFEKVKACDAEGNIENGFIEEIDENRYICKLGNHFCLDYVVAWQPYNDDEEDKEK